MRKSILSRFFPYAGGKIRLADSYPRPCFEKIIEPFAGSAGYSTRFAMLQIELYDLDPIIYEVWNYLIHTTSEEIRKLPCPKGMFWVDDLKVCQAAKWLIGFWCNHNSQSPVRRAHR